MVDSKMFLVSEINKPIVASPTVRMENIFEVNAAPDDPFAVVYKTAFLFHHPSPIQAEINNPESSRQQKKKGKSYGDQPGINAVIKSETGKIG